MAWFDGSFDYSMEELSKKFPIEVTLNLRLGEDGKKLAVINDYETGTELYELSDPKAEKDDYGQHVFIQAFTGAEAAAARRAVEDFLPKVDAEKGDSVFLFRKDPERLFQYSFGHVCFRLMKEQGALRSLLVSTPMGDGDIFILPLKRFMHKCPVCRRRSLPYRHYYSICPECGWEDDGVFSFLGVEDYSSANGCSLTEYRENYLQCKARDPYGGPLVKTTV